jgi:hypothetical protein
LREALPDVMRIAGMAGIDLHDSVVSLDGVYQLVVGFDRRLR